MNLDVLQELGMTPAESKVYLALLRLGTAKASPIIRETGLQNSVVHLTLSKLLQNGFVTFVRRGRVRYFQASHPKTFSRVIEEKQARLNSILPQLLNLYQPSQRQAAEVFEGMNGFHSMLYQLIEEGEAGDEFLFFAFYHPDPEVRRDIYPIYSQYERERLDRGFVIKGIVPEDVREFYSDRKQENLVFVDFPVLHNISIFRDKVTMTPWGKRKVSFLLTSEELADHYRSAFYEIFSPRKKIKRR